jgi:putative chitinase
MSLVDLPRLVENLDYSAKRIPQVWPRLKDRAEELAHNPMKLANAAYASKNGNGNELTGDGFRFRGRGFIQLTGHANYEKYGTVIGIDVVNRPERAAWPEISSELALAYWRAVGGNTLAAMDDITNLTKAINGGLNGLEERKKLYEKAKEIFV